MMAVKKIEKTWTSSAGGAATIPVNMNGIILRVVTDPGSPAPDTNYDLTLVDEAGLDLFLTQGLNRHTSSSEHFCPGISITDGTTLGVMPVAYNGIATITIANAGSAKVGTVTIFFRD